MGRARAGTTVGVDVGAIVGVPLEGRNGFPKKGNRKK